MVSLKTFWKGWIVDKAEKPFSWAKVAKSKAYSPIAVATRGFGLPEVLMMPNGMLAREKCDRLGDGSHDCNFAIFD